MSDIDSNLKILEWTYAVLRRVQAREALDGDGFKLLCYLPSVLAGATKVSGFRKAIVDGLLTDTGMEGVQVRFDDSLHPMDAQVEDDYASPGSPIVVLGSGCPDAHLGALLAHELYHAAHWSLMVNWIVFLLPWFGRRSEYKADLFSASLVGRNATVDLLQNSLIEQARIMEKTKKRRPKAYRLISWRYRITDSHPPLEKRIRRISALQP